MTDGNDPAHRPLGDYVELAKLLRLHPPSQAQVIRPDELVIIRYDPGSISKERFDAIADHLAFDFPDLRFALIEADALSAEQGKMIIRATSAPEDGQDSPT